MALMIESSCINCDMCDPECPNQAIVMGAKVFTIEPHKCTECVGHYDSPQCKDVCPIDCIKVDPAHIEGQDELLIKFAQLTGML